MKGKLENMIVVPVRGAEGGRWAEVNACRVIAERTRPLERTSAEWWWCSVQGVGRVCRVASACRGLFRLASSHYLYEIADHSLVAKERNEKEK